MTPDSFGRDAGDPYGSPQPEHEARNGLRMTISCQAVATSAERVQRVVGYKLPFDLPASVDVTSVSLESQLASTGTPLDPDAEWNGARRCGWRARWG
jgi:hypothetical protein